MKSEFFFSAYTNDLFSLEAPKDVLWPENDTLGYFVNVYDWDRLILNADADNTLLVRLVLCTGPLPCKVSLLGGEGASLQRVGNGSFACLGSVGCLALKISKLRLLCAGNNETQSSSSAPFEVEGAVLNLENSSLLGCFSQADGGSVRAYGGATVQVGTIDI